MKISRRKVAALLAASPILLIETGKTQQMKRRPVVPSSIIRKFNLQPSEYGLYVMGEDGKPYSLDDVLAVVFQILTR